MTETGDGIAQATLAEEFLRSFSARWHAAWNSHDHHQVAALCTNDVEWHDPSLPGPGHGAEVIAGLMQTLVRACPDFRFEETEPACRSPARPKAIAPWRFTGTMSGPLIPPGFAPTGRRVEIHGDDHWDFRGDLVCRCEAVYDLNGVGVQLGAVPAPGSGAERVAVLVQRVQAWRLRRSASR
jgi:SnoaL-like domain